MTASFGDITSMKLAFLYSSFVLPGPPCYENTRHECKSWAARACHVTYSEESVTRERRSSFMCHMGVFGLFRGLYKLFKRKSSDTPISSPLAKVLRDAGKTLSTNQQLTHVVNGKVVFRTMDTTFHAWSKQVAS